MYVERTITIDRPIEEVFEYVSTPENDPTWVPVSLRHERTSPGPVGRGTTTEEDIKFLGRTMRYTWEVTECEPPTVLAYHTTSGLLPIALRIQLEEPVEGGARLTLAVDTEPRGMYFGAIAPLMPWAIQRIFDGQLRTLKNLLEGQTPTPPLRSPEREGGRSSAASMAAGTVLLVVFVALFFLLLRRRSHSARR